MRRFGFVLAFLLGSVFGAGILHAVNFTVVLTQAQVDVANWEWNQEDPSHTVWSTAQLFGATKIGNLIDEWKNRRLVFRHSILGGANGYFCTVTWVAMNQTQKDAICTGAPPNGVSDVTGCTACSSDGS